MLQDLQMIIAFVFSMCDETPILYIYSHDLDRSIIDCVILVIDSFGIILYNELILSLLPT